MNYVDQTTDSLRIFLVEDNPEIEKFKILDSASFEWKNLKVDYGILGESHFVTFSNDQNKFTEICACVNASFTNKSNLIFASQISKIAELPISHSWGNYLYAFSYMCVEYNRGKRGIADLHSVREKGDFYSLEYQFPRRTIFHQKPVTEIYLRTAPNGIFIRTVHTYPNDKLAVFTNSALRIA